VRVLGIDPASIKCGYGVIDVADDGALLFVAAGVLQATASHPAYDRITEIGVDLEAVFEEYKPDVVGLEAGFVQSHKGALTLGAARGVAAFIARRRGIAVREYSPSTVKQRVAGHGHAEKCDVARAVASILGMRNVPGDDAGDALAVSICRARDEGPIVSTKMRRAAR
jgi:crossover junction endodeoxyribonuclease RuvC